MTVRLGDLTADPSFTDWVNQEEGKAMDKWGTYLQQNPQQQPLLAEAALIIRGIPFVPKCLPPQVVEQQWQKLQQRLQEPAPTKYEKPVSVRLNDYQYVTLTFFSILVGAVGYWYFRAK